MVRKAREMVTSSDFTQQQVVPMSKHQAAIRHMRKNVEEQKHRKLDTGIAAQHDKKMLREKEKEYARMKMEMHIPKVRTRAAEKL